MYFKKLIRFSSICLLATLGRILTLFIFSIDNCVSTSKVRMLSTSSPKNSIRYGSSLLYENTSIIPPRVANSPGSETKSTLVNLYSKSISLTKSSDNSSPTFTFKVFFSNSLLVITCSNKACG